MIRRIISYLLCGVLLCALLAASTAAVDLRGFMTTEVYGENTSTALPYRIYLPSSVEKTAEGTYIGNTDADYALLIWLHDEDLRGEDGTAHISDDEKNGLLSACITDDYRAEDVIIVAPQCPRGETWDSIAEPLNALLRSVKDGMETGGIYNEERVLLGGIGMGASYGYTLLSEQGEVLPVAAAYLIGGTCDAKEKDYAAYGGTDIYAFISEGGLYPTDGIRDLSSTISQKENSTFTLTEYEGMGHEIWQSALAETAYLTAFLNTNASVGEAETTVPVTESEHITKAPATDVQGTDSSPAITENETTEETQSGTPKGSIAPIQLILIIAAVAITLFLIAFLQKDGQTKGKNGKKAKRK